jgi:hypothetical protein
MEIGIRILNPISLGETLDTLNQALYFHHSIPTSQQQETTAWILERQQKDGRHPGMYSPTGLDFTEGVRLFTGEKLYTALATRNLLGQECARALTLLAPKSREVEESLRKATQWMLAQCYATEYCVIGECAHSAVGFMRYLAVSNLDDGETRMVDHIKNLSQHRDGKGRWDRFPFYYTLLALSEIDLPSALEELRYSTPACERVLLRWSNGGKYSHRRRFVIEDALSRC